MARPTDAPRRSKRFIEQTDQAMQALSDAADSADGQGILAFWADQPRVLLGFSANEPLIALLGIVRPLGLLAGKGLFLSMLVLSQSW